jgi:hypothetical protein
MPPVLRRWLPQGMCERLSLVAGEWEELHLRVGRDASVTVGGENRRVGVRLTREEMDALVVRLCEGSLYAYRESINQGYLTLEGGIRVGICGRALMEREQGRAEVLAVREYRTGDAMRDVHWKLSAKARKYIIREAMEPSGLQAVLSLALGGTPEETDRKLGRLLWLGNHLLDKGLPFHIRAQSGTEILELPVNSEDALLTALDRLLAAAPAAPEASADTFRASWQYAIGGEPDES